MVAHKEGWYLEYFRETYKVWFSGRKEAGSEQNLEETFKKLNKNTLQVVKKSQQQVIVDEYNANTEEAIAKEIFGAPSFSV